MNVFFSIVFYLVSLILFFFVAPKETEFMYRHETVMNIPTMFEALACFILGTMFAIMAYVESKVDELKDKGTSKNELNSISPTVNASKNVGNNDEVPSGVYATIFIIIVILIVYIAYMVNQS